MGKCDKHLENYAWVAELVDARDLKSLGQIGCTSSILVPGTKQNQGAAITVVPLFFYGSEIPNDLL